MRSIASWCVRRRRVVVAAWLVALVALTVIAHGVGSTYKDSFSLSGTQSFDALHLLQKVAPKASGDREQIVFAVEQGKVTDPSARSRIAPGGRRSGPTRSVNSACAVAPAPLR